MKRLFSDEEKSFINKCAEKHLGYKYTAQQLNCEPQTIKKFCLKNNITMQYRKKNRELNEDFFEVIDSSEKAYFLGLMYTDGSTRIVKNNSKQIRISLQLRDKAIIEKFKKILNADVDLIYDKRPNKEMVGFEITNAKLFDDLYSHGIIPNKTYKSKNLPLINNEYLIDFLRGLFDGDGTLSYKENYNEASVGFTNYSYEVVLEFQQYIDKLINKTKSNKIHHSVDNNSSKYTCSWRGFRQVLKILSLLYDNSNIYLQRKYDKYQALLSADKDMI